MKIRATLLESIGNVSVVDRELEPGDTGILVKTHENLIPVPEGLDMDAACLGETIAPFG